MIKKITSTSNPTIIEFSKLANNKVRFLTGLFAVEGEKALEDIVNSEIEIKNIFITEKYDKADELPQDKIIIVNDAVMKKLSSSDSVPRIITVAYQQKNAITEFIDCKRLLLLDGISDPGNMGTIIRSAVAFGFEGILLTENSVDIYNPKVIRSAAGNFFKIPVSNVSIKDIEIFSEFQIIMTDLCGKTVYSPENVPLKEKLILTLGSEAKGISSHILDIKHDNVKINTDNVESLNVATAGSIIMYELSKRFKTFSN